MIESSRSTVKVRRVLLCMILRVRKEDSAYLYQILEASEGLTNYSTLPAEKNSPHRDILLHLAPDLIHDVRELIARLGREIPIEVLPSVSAV